MPRVVAVNRAVYWLNGRCHAWAASERPDGLWRAGPMEKTRLLIQGITVWCPISYRENWYREFPHERYEFYDTHLNPPEDPYGWVYPGWDTPEPWRGGTTVHALAQCCARGARRITLIGCDMHGRGGWGYTYIPEENDRWRNRWEHERGSLSRAITDAKAHGVEITRIGPTDPMLNC